MADLLSEGFPVEGGGEASAVEELPEARYTNYFRIGFNAYEFVVDFGQEYPPAAERIHTRIVLSAPLVRNLSETLERSLRNHARSFGPPGEGK